MIYGSVCSGIEAVSCAWHPLGMRPAWFSEVASFPSQVLAHRWPEVHNHGDFTKIGAGAGAVDVLVGGTPCQSFSVAGGRAGLDDPRGHLAVEFALLARRLGARWVVWENVDGALSVDDGDAFGTFLSILVECGYGVSWRVLDAQHFGVPQRRRRVFVVGHLGDWRPPAAVLLERPSVRRDPRARGAKGTSVAVAARAGAERSVARALTAHHGRNSPEDMYALDEPARCITTAGRRADAAQTLALEQVYAFDYQQLTSMENRSVIEPGRPSPTISRTSRVSVAGGLRPRRLTPREVERCFGFEDDYTLVPVGKKRKPAKDSPRYKALGNSMAVPVVAWLGRRMLAVEDILRRTR